MNEPTPITYRMLHEHFAGYGLNETFFTLSKIDPDAIVRCNCNFDNGHEINCDIVGANQCLHNI